MNAIATEADVLRIENQGPPADLPASTYEMIGRGAAIDPTAPALSFFLRADDHRKPSRWTYSELMRDITRTANMFSRLGIDRHSVVAYVLPNLPQTHFVIWGGEAAGIVCAINPLLEGPAIASLLKAAHAKVLVTLAPFPGTDIWSKIQPILSQVPSLQSLVLIDLAKRVQGWRRMAARVMGRRECKRLHGRAGLRGAVPRHIAIHDFDAAMARESDDALLASRRFEADDISSYFCTGGTTGLPKIAIRRHGNEVANAWSVGQVVGAGMGPGKTVFCGLPLFHVNAVLATGLVPFSRGAHVVLGTPQGYRGDGVVKRFWEIVEQHRINFFSAVPTLYSALLDVPVDGWNIDSLEYGLCGAAPMPVEVFRTFQDRTGVRILEGYGLTEGACVSSVNPPGGERRLGSIGLRIPGQMMKAVILDDAGRYMRDCVENEVGVLTISGPNVFAGYLQEDQNKCLWLDLDDGRQWLNTGDLARRDAQGYFWLTGRRKELIDPGRSQHRSGDDRRAAAPPPGSANRCGNRTSRRACRRAARRVRAVESRRNRNRDGAGHVHTRLDRRACRATEADSYRRGNAAHGGRQDLQARTQTTGDARRADRRAERCRHRGCPSEHGGRPVVRARLACGAERSRADSEDPYGDGSLPVCLFDVGRTRTSVTVDSRNA